MLLVKLLLSPNQSCWASTSFPYSIQETKVAASCILHEQLTTHHRSCTYPDTAVEFCLRSKQIIILRSFSLYSLKHEGVRNSYCMVARELWLIYNHLNPRVQLCERDVHCHWLVQTMEYKCQREENKGWITCAPLLATPKVCVWLTSLVFFPLLVTTLRLMHFYFKCVIRETLLHSVKLLQATKITRSLIPVS